MQIDELMRELAEARKEIINLTNENTGLKKNIYELVSKNNVHNKLNDSSSFMTPYKLNKTPSHSSTLKRKSTDKPLVTHNSCKYTQTEDVPPLATDDEIIKTKHVNLKKNKMCVISNESRYNLINDLIDIMNDKFDLIHYLRSGSTIDTMVEDIHKKVADFTNDNFCLIMIGESDFQQTRNYYDVIKSIRESVGKVTNTNIIICLPTYKHGIYNNFYNWRIETFNNLLYLDTEHHKYAQTFDTNCFLNFVPEEYSKLGNLNKNSIRHNLKRLKELFPCYKEVKTEESFGHCEVALQDNNKSVFFRV